MVKESFEIKREKIEEPNLGEIVKIALNKAYNMHELLGLKGEELIQKNQFGETALRVDIENEKAILNFLKDNKIPIRVISEEHGIVDIDSNPKYLGILDGLDGSNRYQAGRGKERYGTMFGIFSNINPIYDDYIAGGIFEHSTGKLFFAEKEVGAFVNIGEQKEKLHVSNKNLLNNETKIYINEYWDICQKIFTDNLIKEFKWSDPKAYSSYFSDLISGNVDLVLTCTSKNNLELAIGFGLLKEAGGIMIDINGRNLQKEKYLEFGQKEQLPIIIASTNELAKELIQYLKKQLKNGNINYE